MTRLFVGNLSFEVTAEDLAAAFAAHGRADAINIPTDRGSGAPRGFAFVDMAKQAQAMAAIQALDGTTLKGRTINVSLARPRGEGGSRSEPSAGWAVVGAGRHRW